VVCTFGVAARRYNDSGLRPIITGITANLRLAGSADIQGQQSQRRMTFPARPASCSRHHHNSGCASLVSVGLSNNLVTLQLRGGRLIFWTNRAAFVPDHHPRQPDHGRNVSEKIGLWDNDRTVRLWLCPGLRDHCLLVGRTSHRPPPTCFTNNVAALRWRVHEPAQVRATLSRPNCDDDLAGLLTWFPGFMVLADLCYIILGSMTR
jgi:hypothetical protein